VIGGLLHGMIFPAAGGAPHLLAAPRAGKFGSSAAIGQVLPPKAQMVVQQNWKYVSGGGRARPRRSLLRPTKASGLCE